MEHPSYVPPCSPRWRACAAGGTTEDRLRLPITRREVKSFTGMNSG